MGPAIEEFRQNDAKMSAASLMFDVLREGCGRSGRNAGLTDQVLNAGVKATPHGWRVTKVEDDLKTDAGAACVMASYLAEGEAGVRYFTSSVLGGRPLRGSSPTFLGSRPARKRALRKRISMCALVLRNSSDAQRARAS